MRREEFEYLCQRVNAGEEVYVTADGDRKKVLKCDDFAGALVLNGEDSPVPFQMAELD